MTSVGRVYVFDATLGAAAGFYQRLMVFEPEDGTNFTHYEYKGEVTGTGNPFPPPVVDAAGNLYEASAGEGIEEYEASALLPGPYPTPAPSPLCAFHFAPGGTISATVDPADGEVFFSHTRRQPHALRPTASVPATR